MGKRLSKSEKLDLILSELAKLRGEVKKLLRDRAAVADQRVKAKPRSAPERTEKVPKRAGAGKMPVGGVTPSKAVLLQAPQEPNRLAGLHLSSHVLDCPIHWMKQLKSVDDRNELCSVGAINFTNPSDSCLHCFSSGSVCAIKKRLL